MKKFLEKIFNIIFVIILFYIIYSMYTTNVKKSYNETTLYITSIIYILIMTFLYKKCQKKEIKKKMFIILFFIILILQLIVAYLFKVIPSWDFGIIHKESVNFSNKINNIEYFCKYPNNIPTMIILKCVYYIFNMLNIKQYINIGISINIFAIDLSIIMLILIIKEILGKEKAFFALFFISVMPVIYLSVPIFYTDTLSMPFPIMIIYIYLKMKKQQDIKNKIISSFCLDIVTVIGMNIKVTVGIIFIAIIIYEILLNKKQKMKNILYPILSICFIMLLIILEVLTFKYSLNQYYDKLRNESMPPTHFIMMALKGDGGFNDKDEKLTSSLKTREEKIATNIKEIKERIQKYDTLEKKINFITFKQLRIWNSGTYFLPPLLSKNNVRSGKIQDLIYKDNEIYIYISQVQRVCLMILILISTFYEKGEEKKLNNSINIISRFSVLGLIIFFTFWEVNPRYIINYILVFTLIEILGIDILNNNFIKIKEKI